MGRKVFISFLGTGNYLETYYQKDDFKSSLTKYIQCALCDMLKCREWNSETDRIIIFCTEKSKESHWQSLYEALCSMDLLNFIDTNVPVIKMGFDETEIWEIFSTVNSKIHKGDQIYFDATHAFRSIPLFSTTLFDYTRFTKGTEVKGIYYGAFEKITNDHPEYKPVSTIPEELRVAPIVDMSSVSQLQQYTTMAANLANFGRMKGIGDAILPAKGTNQNIKRVADAIELLDGYINTNQEPNIKKGSFKADIDNNINEVLSSSTIVEPLKNIIEILTDLLTGFKGEETLENVEAAINWAYKYEMMAQAYTMGLEYLITLGVIAVGEKNPYYNSPKKYCRSYISSLFSIKPNKETNQYKLEGLLAEDNEVVSSELLADPFVQSVKKTFSIINDERIEIDHAKGSRDYASYKKSFGKNFPICVGLLKDQIEKNACPIKH